MKKSIFTLGTIAILSLAACSESTITPAEPTEEVVAPTEETAEPAEEVVETQTLKVGDSVQFNDLKVTVNSARIYPGSADGWDAPTNDFYVIFDTVVENTGAEPAAISSVMNFTLYDADSYAQDMSMMVEVKGSMDGEIGPGRKLAGEMAFDVTDSPSYELIFSDPFATGQAIWQVSKEELAQ